MRPFGERSQDIVSPTDSLHSYVIVSKRETEHSADGQPLSPTSITVLSGDESTNDEYGEERSKKKKKTKFLSQIEQQLDKGVAKLESILRSDNAANVYSFSPEKYEGEVEQVRKSSELKDTPIRDHVNVYHSGCSDKPSTSGQTPPPHDVDSGNIIPSSVNREIRTTSTNITEKYDGPIYVVPLKKELEQEPMNEHVAVYHSGRSDEPNKKAKESSDHNKTPKVLQGVGRLLFKSNTRQDFPVTEPYEGPIERTTKANEIEDTPIENYVTKYHSGLSYDKSSKKTEETSTEPKPTKRSKLGSLFSKKDKKESSPEEETETSTKPAAGIGAKVSGFFKKRSADEGYPNSIYYEGPVETVDIRQELDSTPITDHVQVYHNGRSDEPGPSIHKQELDESEEAGNKMTEAIAGLGAKVSGFFKKGAAHEDYPQSTFYEGPAETVEIRRDLDSLPIADHVQVYHSGRSDEPGPSVIHKAADKPEDAGDKVTGTMAGLGAKVSGFFKKRPADEGYPQSIYYEGPVEIVEIRRELDSTPITEHVQVYHSGRSDEPGPGLLDRASDKLEDAGDKVSGAMAGLGAKVSGFFKKGAAHEDYPKSTFYEGPVETVEIRRDLDSVPIGEHVQVYHSGRSDEPGPGLLDRASDKFEDAGDKVSGAMAGLGAKVSGFFKKGSAHEDYPKSTFYEGPVETVEIRRDLDCTPITEHVQGPL